MNTHKYIQGLFAGMLKASPLFGDSSKTTVIEQNSADLAYELEKAEGQVDTVAVVVAVDRIAIRHASPRVEDVEFSVICTENVAVNRTKPDFVTALDAAIAAVEVIDGPQAHAIDISHQTPGGGVLEAIAKFSSTVTSTDEKEQEK